MISKLTYFVIGASLIFRVPETYIIQPSHLGMILFIVSNIVNATYQKSIHTKFNVDIKIIIFCLIYFSIINLLNSYQNFSILYILNPIALVLAYTSLYICHNRLEIIRLVFFGACSAYIVSILLGVYSFIDSPSLRITGLSGTPNHIAMQGLFLLALSLVFYRLNNNFMTIGRIIFFIGAALSLSRSALAGLALFFILNFKNIFLNKRSFLFLILLSPLIIILMMQSISIISSFSSFELMQITNLIERRLVLFGSADESGRGIYRLIEYPEFLIFGASEMRTFFYGDTFTGFVHNNIAQLWFAFGLPGLLLALHQFYLIAKLTSYKGIFLLAPFLLTHFVYQNFLFNFYIMSLVVLCQTNSSLINYNKQTQIEGKT